MESFLLTVPGFLALLVSAFLVWRVGQHPRGANGVSRETEEEARRIIAEAHAQSEEILKDSSRFRERMEQVFEERAQSLYAEEATRLAQATQGITVEYHTLAEEARGAYVRVLDEVTKNVSEEARNATAQFTEFIRNEMARYERLTDHGLEEWRRTLQSEIEKKKEVALKRVEESIYRILYFVSKEVLGKTIDLEEHQALVIRALDDARRQGFFDL